MIHHLSSRADQISEQIDEQIREYIANNDLEKVSEEGDILTLKSAIIREANQDEEKSEHYSILSGHREDLLNILYSVAGNELEDFQKLEDSYWNHCEQVLDGLKKRKVELQDDYRFAIEDESGTSRIRKTNTGEIT